MKRIFLGAFIALSVGTVAPTAQAGGGHGFGGGWGRGGGCWGGRGWCGGGSWGGWCGPSFSIGFGLGGFYPSYGYYSPSPYYVYPPYGYAYARPVYVQPTYVYRPAQPYSPAVSGRIIASVPTLRSSATGPVYVYTKPRASSVVQNSYPPAPPHAATVPAVSPRPVVAATRPASGSWVMDPTPYSYTPPPATQSPSAGATGYAVTR